MPEAPLAKVMSFEDRLKERVKKDIGELLTDEELKTMVHRSVETIFFTERSVRDGSYSTKLIPPLLHEIVQDCVDKRVRECVENWILKKENFKYIEEIFKELMQVGVGKCVLKAIDSAFAEPFGRMYDSVREMLNERNKG